ncbi:MAG TPA: cytochrome c [Burkholderiaceae bacterium]
MKPIDLRMVAARVAALAAAACTGALADESAILLKDGPGRAVVLANCSACHSPDYIEMNSTFMKRAAWEATVQKMIKVMGAPIRPEDVPAIVDYLARNYGIE